MGISAVNAAVAASAAAGVSPEIPATGAAVDFATLLFAQCAAGDASGVTPAAPRLTALGNAAGEALSLSETPDEPGEAAAGPAGAADPALLAALGIAPPATSPQPPPTAATASGGDAAASGAVAGLSAASGRPSSRRMPGDGGEARVTGMPANPTAQSDPQRPAPAGLATGSPESAKLAASGDDAAASLAAVPHGPIAEKEASPFALQLAGRSTPAAPPASPVAGLATTIDHPHWGDDLGGRVLWMVRHDEQTARINLNPPELGPLQITLSLNGDQASASFASPHAEVRQAIADALPRLREMLSGAGIDLGQANVGTQAQQEQAGKSPENPGSARFSDDEAILHSAGNGAASASAPALTQRGRGLVDLFA